MKSVGGSPRDIEGGSLRIMKDGVKAPGSFSRKGIRDYFLPLPSPLPP